MSTCASGSVPRKTKWVAAARSPGLGDHRTLLRAIDLMRRERVMLAPTISLAEIADEPLRKPAASKSLNNFRSLHRAS